MPNKLKSLFTRKRKTNSTTMGNTPVKVGKYGCEQLEDVQDVVIQGIKSGQIAYADKKFNFMDIAAVLPLTKPLQEAVDGVGETDEEFLDLYDEEIESLVASYDVKAADTLTPQQTAVGRRILKIVYNSGALVREVREGATV